MSVTLTFDGLAVPLRALRLLAVDFGHLPAPRVLVSTIFPNQLELSFHGALTDFETWRETLEIAPDAVTYDEQGNGCTRVLSLTADYVGAELSLVAFADIPARVSAERRDP